MKSKLNLKEEAFSVRRMFDECDVYVSFSRKNLVKLLFKTFVICMRHFLSDFFS